LIFRFTLAERRRNVLAKLKARGVATKEAFIQLAAFLGYTITIYSGGEVADPPYDVPFFPVSLPQGNFVWIIEGVGVLPHVPEYDVPFDIIIGSSVIECFFNKLKPANTVLLFHNLD
jgi:uncharacterized protein YmfQ (DUF2313 family)